MLHLEHAPEKELFWFEGCDDASLQNCILKQNHKLSSTEAVSEKTNLLPEGDRDVLKAVISQVVEQQEETKMRKRQLENGPVLGEEIPGLCRIPAVVDDGTSIEIPVKIKADSITLLGLTCPKKGYPLGGVYGEEAAEIMIESVSGERICRRLCNGREITTVFMTNGSSRIQPFAENAERFATFGYDKNFECYVMNRLEIPVDFAEEIAKITMRSLNNEYAVLVYGVCIGND